MLKKKKKNVRETKGQINGRVEEVEVYVGGKRR